MPEQITISKDELKELINAGVKEGLQNMAPGSPNARMLKRITERQVEVRLIDNRVVVGFKNRGDESRPVYIYQKPDPMNPKEMLSYVDLILEDSKAGEVFAVDFKQFRTESSRALCTVAETQEREWVINQGVVKKKEVEEYSSIELDFDIPVDIVGKTRMFVLNVPAEFGGARKVMVQENYVNIA